MQDSRTMTERRQLIIQRRALVTALSNDDRLEDGEQDALSDVEDLLTEQLEEDR